MQAKLSAATLLGQLGNTAAAAHYSEQCRVYRIPEFLITRYEMEKILCMSKSQACLWIRHPDLRLVDGWDVKHALLQLRGIWSKCNTRLNLRPIGRQLCISWIWRSRLYIYGGGVHLSGSKFERLYDIW